MTGRAVRIKFEPVIACLISLFAIVSFFNARNVTSRLAQTSDSVQGLVAGHAVATGNLFLSGWHFPIDNFYLTDSLPYAVAELIVGSQPVLLVIIPACVYALFVVLALAVSVEPRQSLGWNLQSIAVVALLLVAPAWIGTWNPLLMSDMHTATTVVAFAAVILCARVAESASRGGAAQLGTAAAFALTTVLCVASDPFSIFFAFGPAALVLAAEILCRSQPRSARLTLALLAAGVVIGLVLPLAIAQIGGFTTENDVAFGFAPVRQWASNSIAVLFGILTLLGINPFEMQGGASALVLFGIRCLASAMMLGAFCSVVRDMFSRVPVPLLDRLICTGALVLLFACVPSAQFAKGVSAQSMWHGGPPTRFLVPIVLFSVVLAGRQIARFAGAVGNRNCRIAWYSLLVCLAVLIGFVGRWQVDSAEPRWIARNAPTVAAQWLKQHGLRHGVGEYWSANLLTAMSGNAIAVRSVTPHGYRLVPYVWVEDGRFYREPPEFVIWEEPNQTGVDEALVRATYAVCREDFVALYRIALLKNQGRCH